MNTFVIVLEIEEQKLLNEKYTMITNLYIC